MQFSFQVVPPLRLDQIGRPYRLVLYIALTGQVLGDAVTWTDVLITIISISLGVLVGAPRGRRQIPSALGDTPPQLGRITIKK